MTAMELKDIQFLLRVMHMNLKLDDEPESLYDRCIHVLDKELRLINSTENP